MNATKDLSHGLAQSGEYKMHGQTKASCIPKISCFTGELRQELATAAAPRTPPSILPTAARVPAALLAAHVVRHASVPHLPRPPTAAAEGRERGREGGRNKKRPFRSILPDNSGRVREHLYNTHTRSFRIIKMIGSSSIVTAFKLFP